MLVNSYLGWNCTGQSENVFTTLVNLVNQPISPAENTKRYLTEGHTHMSAEGVQFFLCETTHES